MRRLRSGPAPSDDGDDARTRQTNLTDQPVTVRTLVRVVALLASVAAGACLFLFDEVRAVRGEGRTQHFALVREADEASRFEAEQRGRLDDRIEQIRRDVTRLAVDVGSIGSQVRRIGETTDAILSAIGGGPRHPRGGPED
jgi:uncharacterized protein HemX